MNFTLTTIEEKEGRKTKVKIYVNMPGISETSDDYCAQIWELNQKEFTSDVQSAIKHAFSLGLEAAKGRIRQRLNGYSRVEWKEEDK